MPDDGLTNDTVASTYTYLLYVSSETTGGGIDSNLKVVKGGDGTQTPLWIGDTTVPYVGLTTSLSSQNDLSANGGNSIDWNAAYGWGDHSTQGYLTSFTETDPIFTASEAYNITSSDISNWNAAFSWNDHATYNYLSNSSSISDLSDVNSGFINGYILKFNGSVWEAVEHSVDTTVNNNSANWDSTYTTVSSNSANWDSVYTTVYDNSGSWSGGGSDSTTTTVSDNSANWGSTYTTVSSNSSNWDSTYTTVSSNSSNWDSTYTTVSSNSSNWDSTYTTVYNNSGSWSGGGSDSTTTTVSNNSANWNSTYTTVYDNSGNWETAYGWGDHSTQGYLTSYTETDPIFTASDAYNIASSDITNWDIAYGWGNHDGLYLTDLSSEYLGSLSDVDISSETDLQVLRWDSGNSQWINDNVPLYSLTDVDSMGASSPSKGQLLGWDSMSSYWTPSSVSIPTQLSDLSDIDSALSPNEWDILVNRYNGMSYEWTTSAINTGKWGSTYTTVYNNSGSWSGGGDSSTTTTVSDNSANWSNAYTALTSTSGSWDSVYTTVNDNSGSWGSGGSSLTVQDEGSSLTTAATILDFVGAGVTATGTGATKTITIPGGGGSGGSGHWSQDSSTENIYYSAAKVGISDDEYIDENMFGTLSVRASGFGDTSRATYSSTTPISSYALTVNGVTSNTDDYIEQGIAFRVGTQQYVAGGTTQQLVTPAVPGITTSTVNLRDNVKLRAEFEESHSLVRSSGYHKDFYGAGCKIFRTSTATYMLVPAPDYNTTGSTDTGIGFLYTYNYDTSAWSFDDAIAPSSPTISNDLNFMGSYSIDSYNPGGLTSTVVGEIPGGFAVYDNIIIAGGTGETVSGQTRAGKVWMFEESGGTWSETDSFTAASPDQNALFGSALGIYGDHIAIGAPGVGAGDKGQVHFLTKSGGTWPSTPDIMFDRNSSEIGTSVEELGAAIAMGELDGTPITFVGDPRLNPGDIGRVYVFTYSSSWSLSGFIDPPSQLTDLMTTSYDDNAFGNALSYDSVHKRLAVGSYRAELYKASNTSYDGGVCIYTVDTSTGTTLHSVLTGEYDGDDDTREGANYGSSVALSGNILAVGAPGWDQNDTASLKNAGATYVYYLSSGVQGSSLGAEEAYYSDSDSRYTRLLQLSGYMPTEEGDEGSSGVGGSAIVAGDAFGFHVDVFENHIAVGTPLDKSHESSSSTQTGSLYHYLLEIDSETTGGSDAVYETVTTGGDSLSGFHTPGAAITHEKYDRHSQGYLHIKTRREGTATANLSSTITLDASGNVGFNCYPDTSDSNNPWIEIDGALVLDELSDTPPTPDSGKVVIWYDGTNVKWKNDSSSGNLS